MNSLGSYPYYSIWKWEYLLILQFNLFSLLFLLFSILQFYNMMDFRPDGGSLCFSINDFSNNLKMIFEISQFQ